MGEEKRDVKKIVYDWISKRNNLIFLAILVFAIIIRLYFFSMTSTQPLWWDESDYLAYAKNLAGFNVDWIVTAKHNSLFPYIVGFLFKLGFGESTTKFLVEIIPSILVVILTYLAAKEMYNEKIALITSFLMAISWTILFNSMRFHLEMPALVFGLLAIYVFFKGYEKKEKLFWKIDSKWAIPLTVILVILTYSIRRGYFLFGLFFFVYMLITRKWKDLIKDKYNWIALVIAIILILLAESLIFSSGISGVASGYTHFENPITLKPIEVFESYFLPINIPLSNILLYLFWAGFVIYLVNIFLSLDHIRKIKNNYIKSDLFNIITILITLVFFATILRVQESFGEPRWYFPLIFSSFAIISKLSFAINDYLKKYHKYLGVFFILIVLFLGIYSQINAANSVISSRKDSYAGIKEAGLYLNQNSDINDLIISVPKPQTSYYSERKVVNPNDWGEWERYNIPYDAFMQKVRDTQQARYLLVSFSEPNHPDWMKKQYYANTAYGQSLIWEIPFMNSTIDLTNNMQDIKSEKEFEGLKFVLVDVKQDVFIYRIDRI